MRNIRSIRFLRRGCKLIDEQYINLDKRKNDNTSVECLNNMMLQSGYVSEEGLGSFYKPRYFVGKYC